MAIPYTTPKVCLSTTVSLADLIFSPNSHHRIYKEKKCHTSVPYMTIFWRKTGSGALFKFEVPTLYPLRVSSNSPVETPLHSTYTLSGPWERMFTNSGYSKGAIYSNKKVLRFGFVKIGITPFKKSMDQYLGIFTRQGKVISYLYTIDCVEVRFHNTLTCEDSIWDNFQFKLLQMQQKFYIN